MTGRTGMSWLRPQLREMPVVLAAMLIGSLLLGAMGGAVGLVLGLYAYPPTAWFALLEVGFPAGAVGGVLGLVAGLVAEWVRGGGPPAPQSCGRRFRGDADSLVALRVALLRQESRRRISPPATETPWPPESEGGGERYAYL